MVALLGKKGDGEDAGARDWDGEVCVRVCLLKVSTKRLNVSTSSGSTAEVMNA